MTTRRAGVLGQPISHSLSPALHRAAYAALRLAWTYDAIECDEAMLAALLAESGPEWVGFSCTMPLKRAALELASSRGSQAVAVGAANTLLRAADGWHAENTDVAGILAALAEQRVIPKEATVLGAGGTAQATVVALAEAGVTECTVLVRDPGRATELLATADRIGFGVRIEQLDGAASALDRPLVVSTLPVGAADVVADRPWGPDQAVLDVVYDPWPTRLARVAGNRGATVVSGTLVLLHQAAAQVALMTGQPAPVAAMRAALRMAAGTDDV